MPESERRRIAKEAKKRTGRQKAGVPLRRHWRNEKRARLRPLSESGMRLEGSRGLRETPHHATAAGREWRRVRSVGITPRRKPVRPATTVASRITVVAIYDAAAEDRPEDAAKHCTHSST